MKTIEVTDEMYEFLINLSNELNTQDNRITSMPYFFQIQTEEEISVGKGQGEDVWVMDGDILENNEEIKDVVIEYKEWEDDEANKKFNNLNDFEINEILRAVGYREANRDYQKVYQNAFFTEKACKKHIKSNSHHYNEPIDFLTYASRNTEMELIMKFLCELTGGKLHK